MWNSMVRTLRCFPGSLQAVFRVIRRENARGLIPCFLHDVYAAKPQVMLIGQYSVGKTSFIRYLLGRDFPGQRIGPEPTTDRFTGTSS